MVEELRDMSGCRKGLPLKFAVRFPATACAQRSFPVFLSFDSIVSGVSSAG